MRARNYGILLFALAGLILFRPSFHHPKPLENKTADEDLSNPTTNATAKIPPPVPTPNRTLPTANERSPSAEDDDQITLAAPTDPATLEKRRLEEEAYQWMEYRDEVYTQNLQTDQIIQLNISRSNFQKNMNLLSKQLEAHSSSAENDLIIEKMNALNQNYLTSVEDIIGSEGLNYMYDVQSQYAKSIGDATASRRLVF